MSYSDMRAMQDMMEGFGASIISYAIALVLSSLVLTYAMRWFVFKRAGEKGWKGLIPFLSDYIQYKIAWDGRIYIALLVGQIAAAILGAIFGMIHMGLGTVMGVILNTAVLGAQAVAGMILNFKLARAFGRNDYFAVGLYFLNSIFTAILAFGCDNDYKGPQMDGIGVPKFIEKVGNRAGAMAAQASQRASAAAAQAANRFNQQQPQQAPQQNQYAPQQQGQYAPPAAYNQQGGYQSQQNQGYGAYPQQPVQRTGRRSQQNYDQYDQQ